MKASAEEINRVIIQIFFLFALALFLPTFFSCPDKLLLFEGKADFEREGKIVRNSRETLTHSLNGL